MADILGLMVAETPTLEPANEALEEAHYYWHECQRAYHDPRAFSRSLAAFIQSGRNVTFRLQSLKESLPDFDTWYPAWQDAFREDRHMKWLHDARTAVVHQRGLNSNSKAHVALTFSYAPMASDAFDAPASVPTSRLVEQAVSRVPHGLLDRSLVELTRTWEPSELPGEEALHVLSDCYRQLLALLREADNILAGNTPRLPSVAIAEGATLPCMARADAVRTIRINPSSGDLYELEEDQVPPLTHEEGHRRVERLGWEESSVRKFVSNDPFERAEGLMELARKTLETDGYHLGMVFLRSGSGAWHSAAMAPEDKLDKFVFWHRIAQIVKDRAVDALVFVGEFWAAPVDASQNLAGVDVEKMRSRTEQLIVYAETAHGTSKAWIAPFRHRRGRIHIDEAVRTSQFMPPFAEPVRAVWRERQGISEPPSRRLVLASKDNESNLYDRVRASGIHVPEGLGPGASPDTVLGLMDRSDVYVMDAVAAALALMSREEIEELARLEGLDLSSLPAGLFIETAKPIVSLANPFPQSWGVALETRSSDELRSDEQTRQFEHPDEVWQRILELADRYHWTFTASLIVELEPFRCVYTGANWLIGITSKGVADVLGHYPGRSALVLGVPEDQGASLNHALLAPLLTGIQLWNGGKATVRRINPSRSSRRRFARSFGIPLSPYWKVDLVTTAAPVGTE